MRKQHAQAKLDELIDWYDKFKPNCGQVIMVNLTHDSLAKFGAQRLGKTDQYEYRGRKLEIVERSLS